MSISIIVFGTIAALLVWVLQRKKWGLMARVSLAIILLIFVALVVYVTHEPGMKSLGETDSWYNRSPFFEILAFLCMILGMAVRYITNAIEERRKKILELQKKAGKKKKIKKPKLEFDVWEFSYPFFFSVITFGLLLKQFDNQLLTVSNIIISFETGFIWQTLLRKKLD